jgi:hypothetical protein
MTGCRGSPSDCGPHDGTHHARPGSLFRLAVGSGYLLAPEAMTRRGLAPDVRDQPEGRMSTRGFGALHLGVGLATPRDAARGRPRSTCCAL